MSCLLVECPACLLACRSDAVIACLHVVWTVGCGNEGGVGGQWMGQDWLPANNADRLIVPDVVGWVQHRVWQERRGETRLVAGLTTKPHRTGFVEHRSGNFCAEIFWNILQYFAIFCNMLQYVAILWAGYFGLFCNILQ